MTKFFKLIFFSMVILLVGCTSINNKMNNSSKAIEYLEDSSPWATTAVYKEVDGSMDTSKNYIDTDIANGTISSAQYKDGRFIFIFMKDYQNGTFNLPTIVDNIKNTTTTGSKASGFAYGDVRVVEVDGELVRELHKPSFNPNIVVKRTITEIDDKVFAYKFDKDGETYYVEHKKYSDAFPNSTYPLDLQDAIDNFMKR